MKKRLFKVFGLLLLVVALAIPFASTNVKAADKMLEDYFPNGFSKLKPEKLTIDTNDPVYVNTILKQNDDMLKMLRDLDRSLVKRDEEEEYYADFELKYNIHEFDVCFQFDYSVDGSDWQYNKKWDDLEVEYPTDGFNYCASLGSGYTDNTGNIGLLAAWGVESKALKKTVVFSDKHDSEIFDLDNHTFKVRYRYMIQYLYIDDDESGWQVYFSDWSDEAVFGKNSNQNFEIPDEFPMPDLSNPRRSYGKGEKWETDVATEIHFSQDISDLETALKVGKGMWDPIYIYVEAAVDDPTEKKFVECAIGNAVWLIDGNRLIGLSNDNLSQDCRVLIRCKIVCEELGKESKYDYAVDKVKGLKVKKAKTTSIALTWNKVKDAEFYEIYDKDNKLVTTSKTNSVTLKKLKAATGYDYKVRAVTDKVFVGLFSDTLQCATMPKKSKVTKAALSGEALTLTYKKVAGSGYQIQVATDKKFKNIVAEKTVKDSKTVKLSETIEGASELKGQTLYVRVRAYFTYGDVTTYASWSKVKSFKAK